MLTVKQALIDKINDIAQSREQDIANANAKRGAIQVLQQVLQEEEAAELEAAKVVPVPIAPPLADVSRCTTDVQEG